MVLWANPSQSLTLTPHSGQPAMTGDQSRWIESRTASEASDGEGENGVAEYCGLWLGWVNIAIR